MEGTVAFSQHCASTLPSGSTLTLFSVRPLQSPSLVRLRTTFSGFCSIDGLAFAGALGAAGFNREKSGGGSVKETICVPGFVWRRNGTGALLASKSCDEDPTTVLIFVSAVLLAGAARGTSGPGAKIAALAVPPVTSIES
jgi:hypothetical protein